jgi:hypothetical protein
MTTVTDAPTPAVLPDARALEIAEDHGIDAWALTEQPEIIAAMLDYAGECVAAAATPPASDAAVPAGERDVFVAVVAHLCRVIECGSFLDSQADDARFAKAVVRRLKQEPYEAFAKASAREVML